MLAVGDKIVYPMHGAGIIEAIEEREVHGEHRRYFVLGMIFGDLKVMIPVNGVTNVGIRPVIGEAELSKLRAALVDGDMEERRYANWNRRFNMYLKKLKTGNICEVADVVRVLVNQDKTRKLSTGERRLLNTARQILLSELMLAFPATEKKPKCGWKNNSKINVGFWQAPGGKPSGACNFLPAPPENEKL
jgi:CarD family transcriptional regulator